jgi:Tat protein secretion system quality control protein TatD with DNase activity
MQACAGHIPGTGCAGPLIDSHCHLNYEPLYSSLEKQLADAMTAGVQAFIVRQFTPTTGSRSLS